MRLEIWIKFFSVVKKKIFLGVLLVMSVGISYVIEDLD